MTTTYWQKQGGEPLFSELEWNKPERRDQAGRLLIVGGNAHALNAPAKAYEQTMRTGIGTAKIALPDKTRQLVGTTLPDAVFLPSAPSGEFAQEGINELSAYAQWADTVLLPGDLGRNSQTTILLEALLRAYAGQIIITKDAIESLGSAPNVLFNRVNTTLVASFSQLQRLLKNSGADKALQFSGGLVQTVDYVHDLTSRYPASVITLHENQLIVAVGGSVSTTKLTDAQASVPWRLRYASLAACYLSWYPKKPLEALTHCSALLAHQPLGKSE